MEGKRITEQQTASYTRFERAHAYARRNGYSGCYDEYVAVQYAAYRETCKRCDVRPMTKREWLDRA